jgi:hypothetical protein
VAVKNKGKIGEGPVVGQACMASVATWAMWPLDGDRAARGRRPRYAMQTQTRATEGDDDPKV